MMSAKPTNFDQLAATVGNHEKRLDNHAEKLDKHDHQLRGPDGLHTQVAIIKSELSQIVWIGRIILVALAGLFIADVYRTVTGQQKFERAEHKQPDEKTAEKPVSQLRRIN
jgi:hypothetical protein